MLLIIRRKHQTKIALKQLNIRVMLLIIQRKRVNLSATILHNITQIPVEWPARSGRLTEKHLSIN